MCLALLYCLVCVMQPCGHLLGNGRLLGSLVSNVLVYLSLSQMVSWVMCGTWL